MRLRQFAPSSLNATEDLTSSRRPFNRFGLVLMVNHVCNLRCTYCYTGEKFSRPMPAATGFKAISRAAASVAPGGTLDLGFFGGEPLAEAPTISELIDDARRCTDGAGLGLGLNLTTNGTLNRGAAWRVMVLPDLDLAISHDGMPHVHDRHRRTADGHGTSEQVISTLRRLLDAQKPFKVVMVVRPDTLDELADGIEFLHDLGVTAIDPSLDLWTKWAAADVDRLENAIARAAGVWHNALPNLSVSWFDEKATQLANLPTNETSRCGFGIGEIAVAPSGNLYPCERLIGDDSPGNPMRLPGDVLEGLHFLGVPAARGHAAAPAAEACGTCAMIGHCNTVCRCSNFVRTGDPASPDGLLCRWNQACLIETAKVIGNFLPSPASH